MSSLILGTIGSSLLGPLGGFIGSAIGSVIDAYLFAPDPPDQEGPRLQDTAATAADPGAPIPWVFGADRVGGVCIQSSELIELKNVDVVDAGKQNFTVTTYTYSVDLDFLLCEGPILGIGRVWADGKLARTFGTDQEFSTKDHPYKVGAFPYPSWFRNPDRMYDPALLPWHFDPALAGAPATRWILDGSGNLVEGVAGLNELSYWQDPVTNYYIPVDSTVAYVNNDDEPDLKTWDNYYNLHAALNDWSPSSIFQWRNAEDIEFYRGTDDQPADPTMATLAGKPVPAYRNRAHIVLKRLQLADYGNRVPSFTFEIVRFENETLTSSLVSIIDRTGLDPSLYDITAIPTELDQAFVPGYTIARRTTMRKVIETLIEAFRIDVAEIGPKIVFRSRSRSGDHVVNYDELGAVESEGSLTASITISRRDVLELPRIVEAMFKDIERDYQDNSMRWMRTQVIADHVAAVDLGLVLYPHVAKAWSRAKLRDIWLSRQTLEFTLPPKYIYVSPSDTITVVTDKIIGIQSGLPVVASFGVKATEVKRGANGIITVNGVLTASSLYPADDYSDLNTENNYTSYTNYVVYGETSFEVMDLPPLDESTAINTSTLYYALSDINSVGWIGGLLFQSLNGGVDYTNVGNNSTAAAIGQVTTGILASGYGEVLETDSSVIVTIDSATSLPMSTTIDDMLNSYANLALIGNELVCFENATFLGSGQFQLNGAWMRGIKGTARVSHSANERFVLLSSPTEAIKAFDVAINQVGDTLYYRAGSVGKSVAGADVKTLSFAGNKLKPFSPCMVEASRDMSNNITITWVRRDRTYYRWIDSVDLASSEASIAYQIDIVDGLDTVVRIIDASIESAEYTAAQQITDGLTPGDPVKVRIYQLSQVMGRGTGVEEII